MLEKNLFYNASSPTHNKDTCTMHHSKSRPVGADNTSISAYIGAATHHAVHGTFHCKKTCTSVTTASCHELRRVGIALRGFQPLL